MNYKVVVMLGLLVSGCYWSKDPAERSSSSAGQTPAQTEDTAQDQKPTDPKPKDTPADPPVPVAGKAKVFATRTAYTGNLGGLAGADAKCAQAAQNAGFAGRFVAFLSTSSKSAASRITSSGPWVNTHGDELFGASASSWTGFPKVAIGYDESGNIQMSGYWTGSRQGSVSSAETCDNWTSDEARGHTGVAGWNDKGWIASNLSTPCDFERGLLCVELR